MNADLIALCIVIIFALWGGIRGAATQLTTALALVGAYAGARYLGDPLGALTSGVLPIPAVARPFIGAFLAFVGAYLAGRLFLTGLFRRLLLAEDDSSLDNWLGAGLGLTKGILIVWLGASLAIFVERNMHFDGKVYQAPMDSLTFNFARTRSLFETFAPERARALGRMLSEATTPKPKSAGSSTASTTNVPEGLEPGQLRAYERLKDNKAFQELAAKPEVQDAVAKGDYMVLLKEPGMWRLLADPEALKVLTNLASERKANTGEK